MAAKALPEQSVLLQLLRYEPETGKLFWKRRARHGFAHNQAFLGWNTKYAEKEAFTSTDIKGYRAGRLLGNGYRAHRIIWTLVHGVEPEVIDHLNGDKTDNRLKNLSSGTKQANTRNRKRPSNNTSGAIGVSWHYESQKWMAFIRVDGAQKNLGLFVNFNEAVEARKAAERQYCYHSNHGR